MSYRMAIAFALLLSANADLPRLSSLRSSDVPTAGSFPSGENIALFPLLAADESQVQNDTTISNIVSRNKSLQETSKLALIRYVSGEFAKARKPLPGGKDGLTVFVDKPLDQQNLDRSVATHGAAVNTGDNAQITRLEFHDRTIIVDVNGGGRPKKSWRDHIQFGMGAPGPVSQPTTQTTPENQGPPGLAPGMGGTIYLQFPKSVPDMTPDELKKILEPFLDFSKERSASVHWIDTLPPEVKKAITDRRPALGMDREEVVAAIGKPDKKVRERDANGYDTEDWIYGHPPDKTIFVRFIGDHVTAIKQYPQ